jgi:hypothetical protein
MGSALQYHNTTGEPPNVPTLQKLQAEHRSYEIKFISEISNTDFL